MLDIIIWVKAMSKNLKNFIKKLSSRLFKQINVVPVINFKIIVNVMPSLILFTLRIVKKSKLKTVMM